jgi:hypothetical protein
VIAPGSVRSDGTFYEAAQGFPDLIESFVAGSIPPVPDWIIAGIEWRAPADERCPSTVHVAEGDASERLKRGRGIATKIASALAMVRAGGRNNELNVATAKLAGRAAWSGMTEAEARDLLAWACGINKLIRDDGWPAFNATFHSGWRFGLAKPLPPPRERDADTGGVVIYLNSRKANP